MKTIFKLSLNNFAAYKKTYIRIIFALIALLFLITLISSFTLSINAAQEGILNSNISSNYTFDSRQLSRDDVKQDFETIAVGKVDIKSFTESLYKDVDEYLKYPFLVIDVDGERYHTGEYGLRIDAYVAQSNIFTQNDYIEAGKDATFMLGRYPQNANEIVLSERYLSHFKLDTSVLGKKITLTAVKIVLKNDENPTTDDISRDVSFVPIDPRPLEFVDLPFSMEVTVCGIIRYNYFDLYGHAFGGFEPQILISHDNALADYGVETNYICSLSQWPDRDTEKFITDNEINYLGESTLRRINVTAALKGVINQLVAYFGSALIFGIVFTLILLVEKLCAAQIKNSGVLLMSGLTNRRLFAVWLVQLSLAAVIAVIIASLLTFGAMHGINAIISRTFWLTLTVSAATFFEIMAIGFAAVTVVTVTALGYFALVFRRKQTRELLDT